MSELPTAQVKRIRRWHWSMILPLLAVLASAALLYAYYSERGIPVTLVFQEGYGLKAGDALRYRGIDVGRVRSVELGPDLKSIAVTLFLAPSARDVARQGSRFWIVRPELGLGGASGLETLVGANYLRVLPGQGPFARHFIGLEAPPLLELLEPGGLEVVLHTPGQGNLRRGAPVSYRQVVIGTLLSVDLARDASGVEARTYINPKYAHLVRTGTRFWKVSGAKFSAGWLSGLSVQIDSVQSLLAGGVVLAIPPEPGDLAEAGHRFALAEEPEEAWLEWMPYLPPGDTAQRPQPVPVSLRWDYASWWSRWREGGRDGWVLPVAQGLLGPADLLTQPEAAKNAALRLGTETLDLAQAPQSFAPGIALRLSHHSYPAWPLERVRFAGKPEDTLVGTDFQTAARFVAADQYEVSADGTWKAPAYLNWHGAAVIAANDGMLLGLLLVEDDQARVVLLGNLF